MIMETCRKLGDGESGMENLAVSASSFDIIQSSALAKEVQYEHAISAHLVDHDPWYQLGVLLAVGFNSGYNLSYPNLVLKNMGWTWGSISMVVVAILSFYANCFLAKMHILDDRRFIRYRDLAGYAFGTKMCYLISCLQFLNFILGNMGYLLLAGSSLKQICMAINSSTSTNLQEFVIISGAICFVFAMLVPNLSRLRVWIGVSGVLTIIYTVIVLEISISDGKHNSQNYELIGTKQQKIFNGLNGLAAVMFMHNSGMVPELQATLRQPAVQNMWKALGIQFSFGLAVYYAVTITGYWAYGSSVSSYLLNDLSGPKWAKVLANAAMFLQTIISQHMFCSAVHETLDTKFSYLDKKECSIENMLVRALLRGLFFTVNTFLAALLPFIGDFVNLTASLALIPLTFIFPSMIYLKVEFFHSI
eukprot:TRINITY_DN6082_c0_g1_i2.p1 TRINITY_DN6082_c0_g1~~TRINITY_DN6082_c0_g1_i2.p1  ORF type:complete len:419 (-),score=52.48 TRINITY_DN6082_c0_g1_i2:359-1615(-)